MNRRLVGFGLFLVTVGAVMVAVRQGRVARFGVDLRRL